MFENVLTRYVWWYNMGGLNEVFWLSTKQQANSLASFELFYEELPAVKRTSRVRRVRAS